MILLDTDQMIHFQRGETEAPRRLQQRLEQSGEAIATSIVTVEEQMRGWLARIHRQKKPHRQISGYAKLQSLFEFFADWTILPWDEHAADVFVRLKQERIRVGTMDLKIASIALAHDATLISRNLRDFERVPGLRVEDWSEPMP